MLPYFEPAEARDVLGDDSIRGFSEAYEAVLSRLEEKRDPALPSVLVSHCFVAGSAASDSESTLYVGGSGEVGAGCFRNFTYAALGHLHGPQKAGANGWYSGSPLCYSFDEEKQTLLFAESLSDTQQLTVCLKVLYPEKSGDSLIQILQWKTDTTASWTPDTSQSVYKGGTHE